MLEAQVSVERYPWRLTCNMRVLLRFERKMGRSVEQAALGAPLLTARTLLWAMVTEQNEQAHVSEHQIGQMPPPEFAAAVDQARLLLASSCPRREHSGDADDLQPTRVDWHQLWAIGRYDLGLSDEEFWRLTPAQFAALCDRMEAEREHAEYCAALVASTVANCNRAEGVEPFEPGLFMRGKHAAQAAERRQINEAKAARENLRHIMGAIGAQVVQGGKE